MMLFIKFQPKYMQVPGLSHSLCMCVCISEECAFLCVPFLKSSQATTLWTFFTELQNG